MKKIVYPLLFLLSLLAIVHLDLHPVRTEGCPFCNEKILDNQVFYRGENVLGLITHKPALPGHVLIIPQRHVERFEDLTSEEIASIGEAIKKVDATVRAAFGNKDYLLFEKNGRGAGQSVPHVHFHYLPAGKFLTLRFFLSPWLKPLSEKEMREYRELLQ